MTEAGLKIAIAMGDTVLWRSDRSEPECGHYAPHGYHDFRDGLRWRGCCWGWTAGEAAARIGRGGSGSDPSVPECPVCGAHGGGGHGGLCPNKGKPPEQWVTSPYVSEETQR